MVDTDDMTKEEREEYWEMVIDDFKASGLTRSEYSKKNGIPVPTIDYWKKRVNEKRRAESLGDNRFVELSIPKGEKHEIQFVEHKEFIAEIELFFGDLRIFVNSETPMSLLKNVLSEVGYVKGR